MAIVGVVPIWFGDELLCSTCPAIEYFAKKYALPNTKEGARILYKALCHVLPGIIDLPPNIRLEENIGCKVLRHHTGKNKTFHDVVIEGQDIFVQNGSNVDAIGNEASFDGGILDKFSWNENLISRDDFIEQIQVLVPNKYSSTWSIPDALLKNAHPSKFKKEAQHARLFSD